MPGKLERSRDVERQHSAVPVERVAPQVAILSSSVARPTGRVEGRGERGGRLTVAGQDTGGLSRCAAPSWPCAEPIMLTRPWT